MMNIICLFFDHNWKAEYGHKAHFVIVCTRDKFQKQVEFAEYEKFLEKRLPKGWNQV